MLAYGGQYTPTTSGNGYEFVPTLDAFFWTTIGVMITGFALAAAGAVTQFAAWIGAVVNTYQLEEKTWFWVLLAGGLLGLVWGMIPFRHHGRLPHRRARWDRNPIVTTASPHPRA